MSKFQVQSMVNDFFARGGKVTQCPDRVLVSTPQLDTRKLRAEQLRMNVGMVPA